MLMPRIQSMLESCATDSPVFPPTLLYNEGWLLRLVIDWFSTHKLPSHPLTFSEDARWFSEALLPSAFLARDKGDTLAESWTHADGVIGHFVIGRGAKADLSLLPDAKQLVILEAKMFAPLSPGVIHARYFDQAARTVACIAEILSRANRQPSHVSQIRFYVVAPQSQVAQGVFDKEMDHECIRRKVDQRVKEYDGAKDRWYTDWFEPTFQQMEIKVVSWEELIGTIGEDDSSSAGSIEEFYEQCVRFNQQSNRVRA